MDPNVTPTLTLDPVVPGDYVSVRGCKSRKSGVTGTLRYTSEDGVTVGSLFGRGGVFNSEVPKRRNNFYRLSGYSRTQRTTLSTTKGYLLSSDLLKSIL